MKGIILAAGLGKRLGSITKKIPKPLLPIKGTPVIRLIIKKMQKTGIKAIGINLFYKGDIIKESLKDIPGIKFVMEKYLSGTGGALLNFKNYVSEDFLIHNCDVLSNINLKKVLKEHKKINPLATIVLVNNYKTNRVRVMKKRIVKFYKKRMNNCYTYAGIAVLSKRVFKYFPQNKKVFSLTEVYNRAIRSGELLYPYFAHDTWYDIGTPQLYHFLKHNNNPIWKQNKCKK